MTTAAIAAWEAEGLRLLRTAAKAEDRAELRASAERISTAARGPRSRPAFERVASLTSEFLAAPSLCALSVCSRSMLSVARDDSLWRSLTARTFPEVDDFRRAGALASCVSGFGEFTKISRTWKVPCGITVVGFHYERDYSVIFVFKAGGRRIAGGCFPLENGEDEEGEEWFFMNLGEMLQPPALEAYSGLDFSVSVCIFRRRGGACLQLMTDVPMTAFAPPFMFFNSFAGAWNDYAYAESGDRMPPSSLFELNGRCCHNLELTTPVFNAQRLMGFRDARAKLTLYKDGVGDLSDESRNAMMECWAASDNWVY